MILFRSYFSCPNKNKAVILHFLDKKTTFFMFLRTFFLFLLMATSIIAMPQKTMNDLIRRIPQEILPGLDGEQLVELAMGRTPDDTIRVKNSLNGITTVDSISDDFVKISSSNITQIQVRLLTRNDSSKIICVVKSFLKPIKESQVSFYDNDFDQVQENFNLPDISSPTTLLETFTFQTDSITKEKYLELLNLIDPVIINADYSDATSINYEISFPLTASDKKDELQAILRKKSYRWNGQDFEPML